MVTKLKKKISYVKQGIAILHEYYMDCAMISPKSLLKVHKTSEQPQTVYRTAPF